MDLDEIKRRMNGMPAALADKGKVEPQVLFACEANASPFVSLSWKRRPRDPNDYGRDSKSFHDPDLDKNFRDAAAFIAALPSKEEARLNDFAQELGRLIDAGRDVGIPIDYINPLLESMKKISENAVTYRPEES